MFANAPPSNTYQCIDYYKPPFHLMCVSKLNKIINCKFRKILQLHQLFHTIYGTVILVELL